MNFGGGKGLVIGDVPAAGKAKSGSKKGGGYDGGGGQMMATIASMFQALAGQPPAQQWGGNWQPATSPPQQAWSGGWGNGYQAQPNEAGEGKGTWQAQASTSEGKKGGKGGEKGESGEEENRRAYEEWKQNREREMQMEQQAAAGTTLRWTTTEQRRGRVKLFLPPEAVRATPMGPKLKHQTEVYGRMVYDWGAVLGRPTPEMIAETTRDLEDGEAHRCQVVCFTGGAARQAAEYETIVTLKGNAQQTQQLQKILGGVDLRDLRRQEIQTLEEKIKEWAEYHGRPYGQSWTTKDEEQSKQIEKMTRMLRRMGLTSEEIAKRLREESLTQEEDVEMGSGSEQPTEPDDSSKTRPWQPPYMDRNEEDIQNRIHVDSDSYLRLKEAADGDDSDSAPIGPMTNMELLTTRKQRTEQPGAVPGQRPWRKGLPKKMDKPGAWDVFNADTQPEQTRSDMQPGPSGQRGTAGTARGRNMEEGMRKTATTETRKTDAKTRSNKSGSSGEKTQPPRGGRGK